MKPIKTKAEIRAELDADIERFLADGGEVDLIPKGVSGDENKTSSFQTQADLPKKQARTPLTQVIKDLEARKGKKKKTRVSKKQSGPKKTLIVDDFGEPVRWIWQEKE